MSAVISILSDLIRIPSINPMGRSDCDPATCGEARMGRFLADWLAARSIRYQIQNVEPGRDNILAFLPATQNSASTILWEVHQDTVPVDNMTVLPFGGVVSQGRVYGRGACDVKGSMASMLAALEQLAQPGIFREKNLMVAFTVDEEHTFLGVQRLASEFDALLPSGWLRPECAIVAEPTHLDLVTCHKGVVRWVIRVKGRACHSSMPHEGANAVFAAAPVLAALELLASQIANGSSHPVLGTGTLSVGMVRGGSAPNIVPDTCEIIVDRRLVPGETAEMATAQVRSCLNGILAGRQGVTVSVDDPWLTCPPLPECVPDLVLESLLRKVQRHVPNAVTRPVSFGTDASSLAQIGIPSLVFGPGGIEQAHTKDEWVEIEQLNQAVSILFDCVAGIGHR